MQKAIRINEAQLQYLASKARGENTLHGHLYKKSVDTGKWQLRWFALYQNLLFYYENDSCAKPSGMALLEGCYCEKVISPGKGKDGQFEKQYCFAIYYRKEGQRQYELRAETESECTVWMDAIVKASFSKVLEQKEQLEQKHLHILQILDSERQAKWHYVQQTEELASEVKKLKNEIREYKAERRTASDNVPESEELKKIKKVQSFFRGWLCRRRWKQIVELYIRSEHAESMRKRNSIVFHLVECEEEYVKQLSTLVSVFLRPFRMAASSKNPPVSHDDVNSIFLNRDLFDMLLPMLGIYQEYVRNHHYSLQVLAECKQKAEFNQLLQRYEEKAVCEGRSLATFLTYPMHQVPRYIITIHELLAHTPHDHVERKSLEFALSRLEELSQIMQDEVSETENIRKNLAIERMIVEGCDILLDVNQTFVRQGTLIQVTSDKSKSGLGLLGSFGSTFKESRKDVVRQVFLFTYHLMLTTRASNGRLHLAKNFGKIPLIDCTLIEDPGTEFANFEDDTVSCDSSLSLASQTSGMIGQLQGSMAGGDREVRVDYNGLDFRIMIDSRSGPPVTITLVASTLQEKSAWCSDISQCIENLHYTDMIHSSLSETLSSVSMPQSVRTDPKLFRDDVDIKFNRSLNSCKVPQIRHASVDRLLDRLTDLRFLSIDFLNTFLLTYRVFTTGQTIVEALRQVYRNPECGSLDSAQSMTSFSGNQSHRQSFDNDESRESSPLSMVGLEDFTRLPSLDSNSKIPQLSEKLRKITPDPARKEVTFEKNAVVIPLGGESGNHKSGFTKYVRSDAVENQSGNSDVPSCPSSLPLPKPARLAPIASCDTLSESFDLQVESGNESCDSSDDGGSCPIRITTLAEAEFKSPRVEPLARPEEVDNGNFLCNKLTNGDEGGGGLCGDCGDPPCLPVPYNLASRLSSDTLADCSINSSSLLSAATSSDTLVPGSPHSIPTSPQCGSPQKLTVSSIWVGFKNKKDTTPLSVRIPTSNQLDALALSPASSPKFGHVPSPARRSTSPCTFTYNNRAPSPVPRRSKSPSPPVTVSSPNIQRACSPISFSYSSPNIIANLAKSRSSKLAVGELDLVGCSLSPRSSCTVTSDTLSPNAKAGIVVTSSRASKRRSSSSAATAAFAAATAGSSSIKEIAKCTNRYHMPGSNDLRINATGRKRESIISTFATMRVLNVLRHWVTKHSQDFESDRALKQNVKDLLDEMMNSPTLLPAEYKAANMVACALLKEDEATKSADRLEAILAHPETSSKDSFESLSALDIAEQLTFLDQKIFMAINIEELLGQSWMKPDKSNRAPHVLLVSKRFNEASRLVVSEIVGRQTIPERVVCIEKWAAIADICRCMHNYNGVLQICAAFVNSSIYRLRKTWEKIPKQTKQMIDKLQLLVSADGRFKNMRDALHRCDPPCIPYLGMYLTDLSFIEEGTSNTTDDGLVNFSKMRMIAHVMQEIQTFQQTPYKIEYNRRVADYLLDTTRLIEEEQTFRVSLEMEPRTARASVTGQSS